MSDVPLPDLDALEAKARAVIEAFDRDGGDGCDGIALSAALDSFESTATPDVVLALIDEVRRLQQELSGCKDSRVEWNGTAEVPIGGGLSLESWKAQDESLSADTPVRIYSGEHNLWWKPDGRGYTALLRLAGIFAFGDALARSSHCGPEKGIVYFQVESP